MCGAFAFARREGEASEAAEQQDDTGAGARWRCLTGATPIGFQTQINRACDVLVHGPKPRDGGRVRVEGPRGGDLPLVNLNANTFWSQLNNRDHAVRCLASWSWFLVACRARVPDGVETDGS